MNILIMKVCFQLKGFLHEVSVSKIRESKVNVKCGSREQKSTVDKCHQKQQRKYPNTEQRQFFITTLKNRGF